MSHLRSHSSEMKLDSKPHLMGLLDIDGTLIQGPTIPNFSGETVKCDIPYSSINWNLIHALKKSSWRNADFYLFTNMIFFPAQDIAERHQLVKILKENGLNVLGIITPADLVYHLEQDETSRHYLEDFNHFLIKEDCLKKLKKSDNSLAIIDAIQQHPSYQAILNLLSCRSKQNNLGIAFHKVTELNNPHQQSLRAKNFLEAHSIVANLPHLKGIMFQYFLEHLTSANTHCLVVDDKKDVLDSVQIVHNQNSNLTLLKKVITTSMSNGNNKSELEYLDAIYVSSERSYSNAILSQLKIKGTIKNATLIDPDLSFKLPEAKSDLDLKEVLHPFDIYEKARILQRIVQAIPASEMDNKKKFSLCSSSSVGPEIIGNDDPLLGDTSYHESLPTLLKVNIKHPITTAELNIICQNETICLDDLLLLSISYIANECKVAFDNQFLQSWHQLYAKGQHLELKEQVQKYCSEHQSSNPLLAKVSDKLSICQLPHPSQVSVRRFFETRLAHQFCATQITEKMIQSVNNITLHALNRSVTNAIELQEAIFDLGEIKDKMILNRCRQLQSISSNHAKKGRTIKPNFKNKWLELKGEKLIDKIESNNPGILKSTTPNFFDYRSQHNFTNKVVDIYHPENKENDYPLRYRHSPFVSSLSGHSFFVFAILEKYIESHSHDPDLSNDINHFLLAFISFYVMRGYHSVLEIMHVFLEESMLNTYAKYHLTINPALIFENTELLTEVIHDSTVYAKSLALKAVVNQEICQRNITPV